MLLCSCKTPFFVVVLEYATAVATVLLEKLQDGRGLCLHPEFDFILLFVFFCPLPHAIEGRF